MHGKDFLKDSLICFFIIVTCVNVATYILGSKFDSGANITYEAFLSPVFFGACSSIPNFVMYSRHELSVKEIIVRKILQLVLLEALLYFVVSFGGNIPISDDRNVAVAFMAVVFIIFVVVHVITYVIDLGVARAMNSDLKEFQKRNS